MCQVNIDTTLCRIMEIYRLIGIWRNEGESDCRKSCMRILYFLHYFSFLVYISKSAYEAYLHEDMDKLIFLVDIQIGAIINLVKLAYLLWRKDEIFQFLYDPIVTHSTGDYGQSLLAHQPIRKFAAFIKGYALIINITELFVISIPILTSTSDVKMLPMFMPFNLESYYDAILYWMVYMYASANCFFSAFYSFTSIFIWYVMYNYGIEYKLLGQCFRTLGSKKPNTYHQELIALIRAHNNLVDTVEKFRSCFSTIFFLEITTGSFCICTSTYNLAFNTPENVFELMFYSVVLLYSFFAIFLIMYLSNEITIESDRLSYCLFESNWIDQSESTKRCVVIVGELMKSPQSLVIFIYPMNLEKFTSIVNCAYSMFNILKNLA